MKMVLIQNQEFRSSTVKKIFGGNSLESVSPSTADFLPSHSHYKNTKSIPFFKKDGKPVSTWFSATETAILQICSLLYNYAQKVTGCPN